MRKTIRSLALAMGVLLMLSASCEKADEPPLCSEGKLITLDKNVSLGLFVQMNSKKDSLGLDVIIRYQEKDKEGNAIFESKTTPFDNVYIIVNPEIIPYVKAHYEKIPKPKFFPATFGEIINFEYRFAEKNEIPPKTDYGVTLQFDTPPVYDQSKMKFIFITKICTK